MASRQYPKFGVLHVQHTTRASYYDDWLDAFCASGGKGYNIFTKKGVRELQRDLPDLDGIVSLHSTTADNLYYLKSLSSLLQGRKGRLVVFVGNEYNSAGGGLSAKRSLVSELGADVVATQLLQETGDWLYRDVAPRVISVPHALNQSVFSRGPDFAARKKILGVRSFRYPAFLGDDDRNRLLDEVSERSLKRSDFDVSTIERLSREDWRDFLQDSVSTISSEAGSFYLEKDDRTVRQLQDRFQKGGEISSDSLLYRLGQRLPFALKQRIRRVMGGMSGAPGYEGSWAEEITFSEVEEEFFSKEKRCPFHSKIISARHLEAVGTGTIQILLEGRYNDLLEPGLHYLELQKNLGNLPELLDAIAEPEQFSKMTANTLEMVLDCHTHRHRVDQVVSELVR